MAAAADRLRISTTDHDTHVEIALEGEIDMMTGVAFAGAVRDAHEARPALLRLDFDGVTFMDSTGLAILAQALRHAAGWGGTVRVENPSRQVRRLFDITQLSDDLLEP